MEVRSCAMPGLFFCWAACAGVSCWMGKQRLLMAAFVAHLGGDRAVACINVGCGWLVVQEAKGVGMPRGRLAHKLAQVGLKWLNLSELARGAQWTSCGARKVFGARASWYSVDPLWH